MLWEIEFTSFLVRSFPPKSLDHVSLRDIIYFLIWKDKDSRTQLHLNSNTHQGSTSKPLFSCGCPRRLAFKTVDSYMGQLQAILHDHLEATGTTITDTLTPSPATHPSVKRYLKVMTEEQLSAGATPRQAEPLFIGDLVVLCKMINNKLHTATIDPLHLYIHTRDLAYFKLHLFSGDRPSDLAQIKAGESLCFPNDKGILFDHVFGKTLLSGDSRVFAVARHPNSAICHVQALDDYIPICTAIKISLHSGPLFRATRGNAVLPDVFSTDAAEAWLKSYLEAARLSNNILNSFRRGGAITMALTGSALDDIVEHMGWKSHCMTGHYLPLHKSLLRESVEARMAQATPDTSSRYEAVNQLRGFESAFSSHLSCVTSPPLCKSPRKV